MDCIQHLYMHGSQMKLPSKTWRWAAGRLALGALAVAAAWFSIPPYRGDLRDYGAATIIRDRRGRPLRVVLARNGLLSEPIPRERTGDWAARALVAGEDKRFYRHGGVDLLAVGRAAWRNLRNRRIVSGASTISMLVGKLTEPRPRTFWTKLVEARHALELEKALGKEELIGQYLNRAPFGGNLVGIEAAARRYFAKSAADLTLSEAALLIGIPQAPSRLRPDLYPERAGKRRNYILEQMRRCGFITEQQFRRAAAQEILVAREPRPFLAPHFCDLVARLYPRQPSIVTSLDLDLQALAEKALRARLEELRENDVRGGAIVVLEVRTGAVQAMVGSPDYAAAADSGQVNGALARRSPGSALKPFVYALALDEGLCSPRLVVADVPMDFAGYRPQNFNRDYCGPVSARDALVQSLNIPALIYVQKLGLENVVRRLRAAGLATLDRPAEHYGLGIAIGACEVTLLELANAYACLARQGGYRAATCLEQAAPGRETRLFSDEAAYLVAEILSGDERAADAGGHLAEVRRPRVAWKTGTSAGNRDAWCLAYNPEYVVGVWLGNPAGRPSRALIGSSAAAPVALGIFRQLYPKGDAPWYARPRLLGSRQVCKTSGMPPNPCCPETVPDDYLPGITVCAECNVHQAAVVGTDPNGAKLKSPTPYPSQEGRQYKTWDPKEFPSLEGAGVGSMSGLSVIGESAFGGNLAPFGAEPVDAGKVREVWPPAVQAFLAARGMETAGRIEEAGADQPAAAGQPVRITSPGRSETFRLVDDTPAFRQEITLRAVAGSAASGLYWFVDRQLYCRADQAADVLWPLARGAHVISCHDSLGHGDSVTVVVE